ncbi:uncharacterized protein LOC143484325 [Brachyhypopomus gauderio]|uniref:uncharacterized protein LOC143484325 n=1 Tax=Brachyhypopomus gauderio TaxID=698409 RepID=UPI0040410A36
MQTVARCGKAAKMNKGNYVASRSSVHVEKDPRAADAPRFVREPEGPDVKSPRLMVNSRCVGSYLQCPFCYFQCNTKCLFQLHVGTQHPLHSEDMPVGRLGKVVIYQRTAKLFHCRICFFTTDDYAKLFDHLQAKHCMTRKAAEEGGAKEGGAKASGAEDADLPGGSPKGKRASGSCSEDEEEEEEEEEEDDEAAAAASQAAKKEKEAAVAKYIVKLSARYYYCKRCKWRCKKKGFLLNHVSLKHKVPKPHACKECDKTFWLEMQLTTHVNMCHKRGLYQCLYCPFKSNVLRGIRRHHTRCRANEDDWAARDEGPERD